LEPLLYDKHLIKHTKQIVSAKGMLSAGSAETRNSTVTEAREKYMD
jgi:hypothetical protein